MQYKTTKELEVAEFATELIAEHLDPDLWAFTIDRRSRRTHGWCEHNRRTGGGRIAVAAFTIAHGDDDELFDTVTHELAHAIVGNDEGHGPRWVATHKSLGGNGERYARAIPGAPKGKWRADCQTCGSEGIAYRWRLNANMRTAYHTRCGETLTWVDLQA